MATKMGFEGLIYYGAAGSTASTALTNTRDVSITLDSEDGDTTVRGDGSSPPIETTRVTKLKWSCEFTMLMKTADAELEALQVAAAAGNPVALRMKDHSSGKGFDGDVTLTCRDGKPLNGEQTKQFTAKPNGESRTPQLYV